MKTTIVLIFLIFVFCNLSVDPSSHTSTALTINTDVPNSYGTLTLVPTRQDTVMFSNGITLEKRCFSNYAEGLCYEYLWGIVFAGSSDLIKIGTSDTEKFFPSQGGFLFNGNSSDTNWLKSDTVPSTLAPLPYNCKLCYEHYVCSMGYSSNSPYNNKAIIYAQTKTNNIKFQISDVILNPSDTSGNSDSIKISWMVDSLGNGKFKN